MPTPPALSKAYCTYANIPFPNVTTASNCGFSWLFNLKLALMNQLTTGTLTGTRHANSVWTCYGSSNGTAAGMDGVDRWGTTFNAANFVRNTTGVAHSWFVLYNATSNLYLLLDCNNASGAYWRATLSRTAPTAFSTATYSPNNVADGVQYGLANNDDRNTNSHNFERIAAVYDFYSHITFTDDGQFFYVVNRGGDGFFNSGHIVARMTGGTVGDGYEYSLIGGQFGTMAYSYGFGWPIVTSLSGTGGMPMRGVDNSTPSGGTNIWNFGNTASNALGQAQYSDILSNDVYLYPVTAWSTSPFAYRGVLADCYNIVGGRSGVLVPNAASPSWITLNKLMIPWVGAAPLL